MIDQLLIITGGVLFVHTVFSLLISYPESPVYSLCTSVSQYMQYSSNKCICRRFAFKA
jgi:hypothetical protein